MSPNNWQPKVPEQAPYRLVTEGESQRGNSDILHKPEFLSRPIHYSILEFLLGTLIRYVNIILSAVVPSLILYSAATLAQQVNQLRKLRLYIFHCHTTLGQIVERSTQLVRCYNDHRRQIPSLSTPTIPVVSASQHLCAADSNTEQ